MLRLLQATPSTRVTMTLIIHKIHRLRTSQSLATSIFFSFYPYSSSR